MNKRGRPFDSGLKFISLKNLNERFPVNFCIPLASSFVNKYKLLDGKVESAANMPIPSTVQVKIVDFNKEEE